VVLNGPLGERALPGRGELSTLSFSKECYIRVVARFLRALEGYVGERCFRDAGGGWSIGVFCPG
jgi:hypothetical protein